MAKTKKKKNLHSYPPKQKPALKQIAEKEELTDEDRNYFAEHYTSKHLIVNLIHIWRDSAPKGFISFFPVMVLYLSYCVIWFIVNFFLLFKGTAEGASNIRLMMLVYTPYIGSFCLPILLTYLHVRYDIRNGIYYYIKNVLYVLIATFLFIVLTFINFIVAVLFEDGFGTLVTGQLKETLIALAFGFGAVLICSAFAQAILMARKTRDEAITTPLGLKIGKNKKKM